MATQVVHNLKPDGSWRVDYEEAPLPEELMNRLFEAYDAKPRKYPKVYAKDFKVSDAAYDKALDEIYTFIYQFLKDNGDDPALDAIYDDEGYPDMCAIDLLVEEIVAEVATKAKQEQPA